MTCSTCHRCVWEWQASGKLMLQDGALAQFEQACMAASTGSWRLPGSSPADRPVNTALKQLPLLLRPRFPPLISCCAGQAKQQASGSTPSQMSPSQNTTHASPCCCVGSGSQQASSAGRSTSPAQLLSADALHPSVTSLRDWPPLVHGTRQRPGLQANPSVPLLTSLLPLIHPVMLLCRL